MLLQTYVPRACISLPYSNSPTPHINITLATFVSRSARATPDGRLQSYNLYVIGGTLAQVGS